MVTDDPFEHKTEIEQIAPVAEAPRSHSPCLIVLGGKIAAGRMFKLEGEMVIGRTAADITLEEEGISRRHAKIRVWPDHSVELTDLHSTNGTFHNGRRIEFRKLEDGDRIQLGSTILKFTYQDALDEAYQQNLYESATRDGLTEVYNRKFLVDALEKEFAYALRHETHLSVVMMDVDHFKQINDTYGHPAGDYVLKRIARKAGEVVRAEDVLARYGGEEFAIVLRETSREEALACAERIRRAVELEEFSFHGDRISVTMSAGVASLREDRAQSAEALLLLADRGLYLAKRNGRNRVEFEAPARS